MLLIYVEQELRVINRTGMYIEKMYVLVWRTLLKMLRYHMVHLYGDLMAFVCVCC